MSCRNCEDNPIRGAYLRWGIANVEIIACEEHWNEIRCKLLDEPPGTIRPVVRIRQDDDGDDGGEAEAAHRERQALAYEAQREADASER